MQVISYSNHYASPFSRLIAHIIDHLVIGTLMFSTMSLSFAPSVFNWHAGTISYLVLVAMALEILYYAMMESSGYRATIGKIVMGIRVEDVYGQRISFTKALARNTTKLILGFISYVLIVLDKDRRGLHDMVAGTYVARN